MGKEQNAFFPGPVGQLFLAPQQLTDAVLYLKR
jgi:hypothetical protein